MRLTKRLDAMIDAGSQLFGVFKRFKQFFLTALGVTFAGMLAFPLYIIVSMALKTSQEFFSDPLGLPEAVDIGNLTAAWTAGGFATYVLNSAIVVGISLVVLVAVSSLAAYALVEFEIPWKNGILVAIVAGFMVPPEVLVAPLYTFMDTLGWIDTHLSVIAVYVAFGVPFSVFFIRQYFTTLEGSYAEAARLDGCTELQVFSRIYLPLSIPAITTVTVFQFVLYWNEFLYALVFLPSDGMRTAPAGLLAFQGTHATNYTLLAAGVLIASIPAVIVFFVFRNYFIKGFTMGRV
ncbi:ABC transporter permease subunit [Halorubrum sp. JWXQ-INN 858]|uniref:carbohydrate ABC transporter permease n=1 Tax=Halorubrum sp. JWXQ-INN 858 TaxID=2690782 RepID=UPI00135AD37D|nr:carbohydrate ABC transporter permease [Halorubrum sp. JWXQ-INN 858]MWV64395.1 ABC transporter permease subunit [Halorubrum sp. JWXQ-INN 858]